MQLQGGPLCDSDQEDSEDVLSVRWKQRATSHMAHANPSISFISFVSSGKMVFPVGLLRSSDQ